MFWIFISGEKTKKDECAVEYKYSEGSIMVNIFDTINEGDKTKFINEVYDVDVIKMLL